VAPAWGPRRGRSRQRRAQALQQRKRSRVTRRALKRLGAVRECFRKALRVGEHLGDVQAQWHVIRRSADGGEQAGQ